MKHRVRESAETTNGKNLDTVSEARCSDFCTLVRSSSSAARRSSSAGTDQFATAGNKRFSSSLSLSPVAVASLTTFPSSRRKSDGRKFVAAAICRPSTVIERAARQYDPTNAAIIIKRRTTPSAVVRVFGIISAFRNVVTTLPTFRAVCDRRTE